MEAKVTELNVQARRYREVELDASSVMLREYLLKESLQFRTCDKYKRLVAANPRADDIYLITKQVAENATPAERKGFQEMMIKIADQMHKKHGIYTIEGVAKGDMRVFDICMAPGGFTEAILKYTNCRAKAFGVTLDPVSQGGLPMVIDEKMIAGGLLKFDVTHLFSECTNQKIPAGHQDVKKCEIPADWKDFHLIFCDGKPERFTAEPWSEQSEIERRRLSLSQLILAMQRIADCGTIVMLLHSIDHFNSAHLLHTFSKFATVNAFKPPNAHKKRSSFYMIAQGVRPNTWAAQMALQNWRDSWYMVSFGGAKGTGELPKPRESIVRCLEEEYGKKLVQMGREIWEMQAKALIPGLPDTYQREPGDFISLELRGFADHSSSFPRGAKLALLPALSNTLSNTLSNQTSKRSDARNWILDRQKLQVEAPTNRGSLGSSLFTNGPFGSGIRFPRATESIRGPLSPDFEARGFNGALESGMQPGRSTHLVRRSLSPESETKGINASSWRDKK